MTDALLERLRQSPVVGRYFTPDGQLVEVSGGSDDGAGSGGGEGGNGSGEGGDGAGSGQGSNSGESGAGDQNAGGDGEGGEGDGDAKLELTQAELDRMIDKRLGRAKTKWETDLTTYANAQDQTETERLQAEKEEADQRAEQATERANQRLIVADAKVAAITAGAKSDRVSALLKLVDLSDVDVDDDGTVDEKAVKKAVEKGLADYPEFKAGKSSGTGRSGGEFNGGGDGGKPTTIQEAAEARMAAQSS